jgi:hypothetical protein
MDNTFNINNISEDRQSGPATWNQVNGLASKFAKKSSGKMDWRLQKQIKACLYNLVKQEKLSFKQANDLFQKKSLPKVYKDMIDLYLENNQEA